MPANHRHKQPYRDAGVTYREQIKNKQIIGTMEEEEARKNGRTRTKIVSSGHSQTAACMSSQLLSLPATQDQASQYSNMEVEGFTRPHP